jgi:hypothetical protein
MKDGVLDPAFLQAACAKAQEEPAQPTVINLKALQADPTVTAVTSTGEITITTIKGGEARTQTSPALTGAALTIEADDQAGIELSADGLVIDTLGDQVELVTE